MKKESKVRLQELITTVKENHPTDQIMELAHLAQDLLDDSPNFLKISKSENPTTGHVLEQVDKRPAVAIMVTDDTGERGIFVKQYRTGCKNYIWECPAGVVEPDQTPVEAVYAELRQEIGLEKEDIKELVKVKGVYASVGWTDEIKHLYIAYVNPDVQLKEQQLDEGEALTYEWKTFKEIEEDPLNKIMPISTLLLMYGVKERQATQKIFIGPYGRSVNTFGTTPTEKDTSAGI